MKTKLCQLNKTVVTLTLGGGARHFNMNTSVKKNFGKDQTD